jgi:hypothetical protein
MEKWSRRSSQAQNLTERTPQNTRQSWRLNKRTLYCYSQQQQKNIINRVLSSSSYDHSIIRFPFSRLTSRRAEKKTQQLTVPVPICRALGPSAIGSCVCVSELFWALGWSTIAIRRRNLSCFGSSYTLEHEKLATLRYGVT